MPESCEACGRSLVGRALHHGDLPENGAVSDEKYAEVVNTFTRVMKDLSFRERYGLELRLKKVTSWFKFHGPWLPSLPNIKEPEDQKTENYYQYARDMCEYLATHEFSDEIHIEACSSNRELTREIVRINIPRG